MTDEGGDEPCWAHLFEDDEAPVRLDADKPTHPRLAAALLVLGVFVLILALSVAPLLSR